MFLSDKDIADIRHEIPALRSCVFLNTGGIGPQPLAVTRSLVGDYEAISEVGEVTPAFYGQIPGRIQTTRRQLAQLIGASPEGVSLLHSTTEGINIVLNGLPWFEGDEIITTDSENNALAIGLANLARRYGLVIRRVAVDPQTDPAQLVGDALTDRTRLVAVSHVTHTTGQVLPMRRITEMAHAAGAKVLCDGAHAVGQIAVDLQALGCDFYVGAGYKWLLGPWGTGFMAMKPQALAELDTGWVGAGSEDRFDPESYELSLLQTAQRFEFGGKSWPLTAALGKAITFIETVGFERIQARRKILDEHARNAAASIDDLRILSASGEQGSGLFAVALPARDARGLVAKLWEDHRVLVQWRQLPSTSVAPTGLRFSFAFFTLESEIDLAFSAIRRILN